MSRYALYISVKWKVTSLSTIDMSLYILLLHMSTVEQSTFQSWPCSHRSKLCSWNMTDRYPSKMFVTLLQLFNPGHLMCMRTDEGIRTNHQFETSCLISKKAFQPVYDTT